MNTDCASLYSWIIDPILFFYHYLAIPLAHPTFSTSRVQRPLSSTPFPSLTPSSSVYPDLILVDKVIVQDEVSKLEQALGAEIHLE